MLWHQVMRPSERGWWGEEAESEREDVPCMCTLNVPTWEEAGFVKRRGGMESASACIGFSPVLRLDLITCKSQIGDRRNNETMRRVI